MASRYEAFNTSGGLGTLCETLEGQVRSLNYKTIRYPGHCDLMRVLLNDLRLQPSPRGAEGHPGERRPGDAAGRRHRLRHRAGRARRPPRPGDLRPQDLRQEVAGIERTAIQVTTAAGICAMLDLLVEGKIAHRASSARRT